MIIQFRITLLLALLAQTALAPVNDLPNPYRVVENYFKLPEGRNWGATSAVEVDRDGASIWIAERCSGTSCLNSTLDPVLKFDAAGKLLKSFGGGMFVTPHGIHLDRDGNIWVTDGGDNQPQRGRGTAAAPATPATAAKPMGHQVFKFSPEGRMLLALGKAGGSQTERDSFYQPNDVLVAPNGDIFVAEGHGGANSRLVKFNKDGVFLKEIGRKGAAPGEFDQPHALAMDSRGRLFVGDRGNNRLQILDQDGKFIEEWRQFGRPSGITIDTRDNMAVADSESDMRNHPGWKRGIRVGSARDGSVKAFIPDPAANPTGTTGAEGVALDAAGNLYGAEVGPRAIKKYSDR